MAEDRANLYRFRPPEVLQVPLPVQPAGVNYNIPSEEKIEVALWWLKVDISEGTLGMST